MDDDFDELLNRLKTLHANGFFKKLHLTGRDWNTTPGFEMFMREMSSFRPLEIFHTSSHFPLIDGISQMFQLKELHFNAEIVGDGTDLETMAKNFVNLERLWIAGDIKDVLPFLRHSKKLKFVRLYDLRDECNTLN